MQFRRRWSAIAVLAVVAAAGGRASFGATAPPPLDPTEAAAALSAAKGQAAVDAGNKIVAYILSITSYTERNERSKDFIKGLLPLTRGTNPDAQLVAAMTIVGMHTLFSDHALMDMLTNPNAAVRYWGAKGLGEIPTLRDAGPGNDINAVQKALGTETSGIVKKEIVRSLAVLGGPLDMAAALDTLDATMVTTAPDEETLEAISIALGKLDEMIKAGAVPKGADATKIATAASWTASLVTQGLLRNPDTKTLPTGYQASAAGVINNALKALNSVSGTSNYKPIAPEGDPREIMVTVDGYTGSASLGGGQVQKDFSGVKVPPTIKGGK